MSRFASFSVAIVLAAAYAFADTPTGPPKKDISCFPARNQDFNFGQGNALPL